METVLITGGSGLLGTRLTQMLQAKGYRVTHLSRQGGMHGDVKAFEWNVDKGTIDPEAVRTADHIVHLAGANIGDSRWTRKKKEKILSSRTASAQLIYEQLRKCDKKPRSFVTASGIGYYGMVTSEHIFTESDPPSNDFLGYVCRQWEEASGPVAAMKIRTVRLRFGVVLARDGGALKKMAAPVRNYIGCPLGTGKQYVPWIHIEDACSAIVHAIENEKMQGAYNTVAPEHITNARLMRTIADVLNKPMFLPAVPSFALKLMLGEMANIVLKGSRASNEKLVNEGFDFKYPTLEGALRDLLK